jgi:hypothetical protein
VIKKEILRNPFVSNRYLYVAVAGAVEALSYLLPIPMMRWTGRRTTSVLLYILSGVALLSILGIPEGEIRKEIYRYTQTLKCETIMGMKAVFLAFLTSEIMVEVHVHLLTT